MFRLLIGFALMLAGCSEAQELAKTEITVNAPRAEVFDAVFNVEEIDRKVPLVSNSGTDQWFELEIDKFSPEWRRTKPKEIPFAERLKIKIMLEDRRNASIRWSINEGQVQTGVTWKFEDTPDGGTKVSFDLLPLEGSKTDGLTLNQLELRLMARQSLDKIEAMARERGGQVKSVNG